MIISRTNVRFIFLLCMVLSVVSCGSDQFISDDTSIAKEIDDAEEQQPLSLVDNRLVPYVEHFLSYQNNTVKMVPIHIKNLDKNRAGTCRVWNDGKKEIIINKSFFDQNSDDPKLIESTVLHELGHCILERGHDSSRIEFQGEIIVKSLMYPYIFSDSSDYESNQEYYLEELFLDSQKLNENSFNIQKRFKNDSSKEYVEFCSH